MKNNGHKTNGDEDIVVKTTDLTPYLGDGALDKAVKDPESTNAMRLLMLQDEEFLNNTFRYNIPNDAYAIAMAAQIVACQEHSFVDGVEQSKIQLGLMASVKGERAEQFVRSIIGNREFTEKKGMGGGGVQGFLNKIYGGGEKA